MAIYLDNSATTKPDKRVIDLMVKMMEEDYGNPSSLHHMGFEAEKAVKTARKQVADALGASPDEIYFTSCGSESDNTAICNGAYYKRHEGKKIITTAIEHPAVLESFARMEEAGFKTVIIPVDKKGVVDMEKLKAEIDDETVLISIMHVNNEIGSIQPIEEIAKIKGKALLHVDMVQSFGKLPIKLAGIDMASVSGHKIHGPKGIGALYIKKGINIKPFIVGGGQERNMRSGTENVPGICGLGLATELIYKDRAAKNKKLFEMKKAMEDIFTSNLDKIIINSSDEGAPHILSVTFEGVRGEVILHTLEQDDIFVSTGSACSSNKKGLSHVIRAIGRNDKQIDGTLRFSLSDYNTEEEVKTAALKTVEAVKRFRKLGSFR